LNWAQRVEIRGALPREIEREDRGRRGFSPSEGRRGALGQGRRRTVDAGEGRSSVRGSKSAENREQRAQREKRTSSLVSGWRPFFLKRDMGAPDSLQCLSGAHRIAHSSCPVNHRTAHRRKTF
jgi:hypothetical protein